MKFTRTALLGVAAAAIAGSVAFAAGHANVEGAVKARQGHMQGYAFNLGVLGKMAKGEVDYDAEAAQRAADTLLALASINTQDYWAPGSAAGEAEGSRTLAAMWDNIPDAIAKSGDLQKAAMTMAESAGSIDGVRAAIGAVGGSCSACHKAYRQPN